MLPTVQTRFTYPLQTFTQKTGLGKERFTTSFLIFYLWAAQQFILSLIKPTSYGQSFTTEEGFVLQLATKKCGIMHYGLSVQSIKIRSCRLTELLL